MDKFRLAFDDNPDEPAPKEYDTEEAAMATASEFVENFGIAGQMPRVVSPKLPIALWRGDKELYDRDEFPRRLEQYKLDHQHPASGDE
jgi:hypothetical protein